MRMSKQEKKGLVPERRFPEFLNAGEWRVTKLKSLAKRTMLRNTDSRVTRVLTNSAEFGIVDQRDFFDKDIAIQGNLDGYYVVEKGDYVYNPRVSTFAPVGPISKNKIGTGVMSPLYTVFRFENSNNDFFEHYFKTAHWHKYMRFVSNSGARHDRMAVTANEFMNMPLPVSSPEEQQKVADCLTSIDELISTQIHKLDVLKAHKKSLMQKLFPAEGETVPERRFPEFSGDWVSKTGKEITSKITKGSSPNWQGFSYQSEGTLFITSENVRDGFLDVSSPKYLPNDFYDKQKNSQLRYGDILINIVGASIGRSCLYLLNHNAFTNQAVALFRVNNKNSFKFISYCHQHDRIQSEVSGRQSDSARPNLSLTDLGSMKFILPSLQEQQKIADCLISADELIASISQKIYALKIHKKGLTQKLFPTIDEAEA